jgi:hypothetical protein
VLLLLRVGSLFCTWHCLVASRPCRCTYAFICFAFAAALLLPDGCRCDVCVCSCPLWRVLPSLCSLRGGRTGDNSAAHGCVFACCSEA